MFQYIFVYTFIVLTLIKDIYAHVDGAKLEEECKIADICRHDQVPVCGIDSCGEMRTFIDTCDMHEFNCDSRKVVCPHYEIGVSVPRIEISWVQTHHGVVVFLFYDYIQKPAHECWVTCKRGRSFKKPLYNADCFINPV